MKAWQFEFIPATTLEPAEYMVVCDECRDFVLRDNVDFVHDDDYPVTCYECGQECDGKDEDEEEGQ